VTAIGCGRLLKKLVYRGFVRIDVIDDVGEVFTDVNDLRGN
jgi:hypothetical protein